MTSAAKPNRRPPFTTLATRLMLTSFSANSLSSRSRCWPSPSRRRRSPCVRAIRTPLEFETALTGGIGQRLDATMEDIAAAIEDDPVDSRRLGAFGDQFADCSRRALVGTRLQVRLQACLNAVGRRQRAPGRIVDNLGIDVPRRPEYRQPQASLCREAQFVAHTLAAALE